MSRPGRRPGDSARRPLLPLLAALAPLLSCATTPAGAAGARPEEDAGLQVVTRSARTPWEMPSRPQLPPEARRLLGERMERHADRMTLLMFSVVLLNTSAAEALAEEVAREPRLLRPGEATGQGLQLVLPERVFQLEDQLAERALAVAEAARAGDEAALTRRFAALTETCVACHQSYLYEGLEPGAE